MLRKTSLYWTLAAVLGACSPEVQYEAAPAAGADTLYTSDRVDAIVVDQEDQPVVGAVVVAIWRKIETRTGSWYGIYALMECLTDGDGRFTVPRWGPRVVPHFSHLDSRDPELWIIKRGYLVAYLDNTGAKRVRVPGPGESEVLEFLKLPPEKMRGTSTHQFRRAPHTSSIWNGKRLTLVKAASARDAALSLAGAGIVDPYVVRSGSLPPPESVQVPTFWREWNAARDELPDDVRRLVPNPPMSLLDYSRPVRR